MVCQSVRRLDQRGWTLAELLVVIAVIGILAAMTIPLMMTYVRSSTVRAGAQELRTGLNRAKQLAITLRQNVCVQPAGTGYQFRNTCPGGALLPTANITGADSTGTFRLQNNVTVTSGAPATFTPLGSATLAGTYTVTGPPPPPNTLNVTVSVAGRIQ